MKPAAYLPEINNEDEVKTKYRYWRVRILYSLFIGYAFYYFTRKSFTFAMPGMIEDLGFGKSQLGLLGSIFSISYGISKFGSGILSDRVNPRYFMGIGLVLTGVLNIFFGFSSSLLMFAVFWGLNGWFQAFGAPPCARFLTRWYSQSERGSWWATWNLSHNVGAFLIPWIVGVSLHFFGWRYALYVPGVICIVGGFFLINRLRDTPQSLGLPPIEKFRNDYTGVTRAEVENEKPLSTREILKDVLSNRYLWMLAFANFFIYFLRYGVNDWTALYLLEAKAYTRIGANGCVSLFEVGGLFGSLFAGWASDRLFNANRGPINVLFAFGTILAVGAFFLAPLGAPFMDSCAMFAIGFAIFGPQLLIGVAAVELSPKQAASTATGFVGFFAYMGAALAGYPLGAITDAWGWSGFFLALTVGGGVALALLLPLWGVKENVHSEAATA